MGITVTVCGETGNRLTEPVQIDGPGPAQPGRLAPAVELSALIPDLRDVTSPCWRFIDRYGNTTFNRMQLPVFIAELDELAETCNGLQRARLEELRALAEFALALPHRYLVFRGD